MVAQPPRMSGNNATESIRFIEKPDFVKLKVPKAQEATGGVNRKPQLWRQVTKLGAWGGVNRGEHAVWQKLVKMRETHRR